MLAKYAIIVRRAGALTAAAAAVMVAVSATSMGANAGGLNIAEHGRLVAELIECGELQAGQAMAVKLTVGQFVEQYPHDALMRMRPRLGGDGV